MSVNKFEKIFASLAEHNPFPRTELKYNSAFELMMAVMLSAQATDLSVNKVTAELFKIANTPRGFLELGLDNLKLYIKSIGLYNTKARNIIHTCQLLLARYHGEVPTTLEELESLPGIGRKTANVILNSVFATPVIAVDTHVARVAKRLGLSHGTTPLAIEKDLYKVVPSKYLINAHHWLVLHGRYTCKARKPACDKCIVSQWCEFLRSS